MSGRDQPLSTSLIAAFFATDIVTYFPRYIGALEADDNIDDLFSIMNRHISWATRVKRMENAQADNQSMQSNLSDGHSVKEKTAGSGDTSDADVEIASIKDQFNTLAEVSAARKAGTGSRLLEERVNKQDGDDAHENAW